MAKKKSGGKKKGSGGIVGAITAGISIIIVAACVVSFLRYTGNTDAGSVINNAKASVNPMQEFSDNVVAKFDEMLNCNILKNSNCVNTPSGGLSDPGDAPAPSHGNFDNLFPNNGDESNNPFANLGNLDPGATNNSGNNGSNANNDGSVGDNENTDDSKTALEAKLNQITIADADNSDYNRADYPHWIIQSGKCDTRETILKAAGFNSNAKTCKAEQKDGFSYTDPYTGKKFNNPSDLDVDHLVPIEYANSHGAAKWNTEQKTAFANDMSQLVAVDASANRAKGSKGPSGWMPKNKKFTCLYSAKWIDTALKYNLSITDADKKALEKGIQSCR